ncbi:MAG: hypothetical protein Q4F41_12590 [Eubacteriales bacterium]|nr:hypothetical protein [Eubacteriales bacterium]
MMYPKPHFLTYFPDAELPQERARDDRSSCLRVGSYFTIQKLTMEPMIDRIVESIYGDERGTDLFLDFSALWKYPSCSVCLIKQKLMDIKSRFYSGQRLF